jgi:hypothetical protein
MIEPDISVRHFPILVPPYFCTIQGLGWRCGISNVVFGKDFDRSEIMDVTSRGMMCGVSYEHA